MDIQKAKIQVKNTIKAYSTKNEYGQYVLDADEQRPIFLMGPPGIGKTAIVKQVAAELELPLVSYSITHHTRQSALGLPKIVLKKYGEDEFYVSEYTMSEIVASVYETIEQTGCKEGILFLDEVNCTSETLTPVMLQFLQFKTFGKHKVPDGWTIVTAGNPINYNRSAKDFDIVTWDRLKKIEIDPDFEAWKSFAYQVGVHASVLTYLEARNKNFYKIEQTVDGQKFVTARGWIDLSQIIKLYESNNIEIDIDLISQYIHDDEIAKDFSIYYDLYNKYKSDYKIKDIVKGTASQKIKDRASTADFDERLSLLGLLLEQINISATKVIKEEDMITELLARLKEIKEGQYIKDSIEYEMSLLKRFSRMGVLTPSTREMYDGVIAFLKSHSAKESSFDQIKNDYTKLVDDMKNAGKKAALEMNNIFSFVEEVWGDGQEMLILVTETTIGYYTSRLVARYGCEKYYNNCESLNFYERKLNILKKGERLWQQSTI